MTPPIDKGRAPQIAYILGGGNFGSRAFARLQSSFLSSNLTVVDREPAALEAVEAAGGRVVHADAPAFLAASQAQMGLDDWIIPAIPIHVAFAWLQEMLSPAMHFETMPAPRELEVLLPNVMRGAAGELYISNADFRCPDECLEPDDLCTATGKPRPRVLHATLSGLTLSGYRSICIVSEQLGPGVGGYRLRALHKALETVRRNPGSFFVSTACKCHGVLHAFHCSPG